MAEEKNEKNENGKIIRRCSRCVCHKIDNGKDICLKFGEEIFNVKMDECDRSN